MAKKTIQAPTCLAMVISEGVSQLAGRYYILGTFNQIQVKQFPVVMPSLVVYLAVTNGHGVTPLRLRLVSDDGKNTLIDTDATPNQFVVDMGNPLIVKEATFHLNGTPFPAAGMYRFELSCDGELITERKFTALLIP